MAFALGASVLKKMCLDQDPLAWQRAKLTPVLFKPHELPMFVWMQNHLKMHHALPHVETFAEVFPEIDHIPTPETLSYYVTLLENQYCYERINKANLESQAVLKADENAHELALEVLRSATKDITEQRYRHRILDVSVDATSLVLLAYHQVQYVGEKVAFGWPYLDHQTGGVLPGEVVSLIGRPAAGKSWLSLWTALVNWKQKQNVLFASMEMTTLPIAQRITALYTGQNIQQLKVSGYSDSTLKKFYAGLKVMQQEHAKFYVIDGNLAASAEDIFLLADLLACKVVFIDGAYLLRHRNPRLDRFMRAAENVELIKRFCTDLNMVAFCSWQFNRQATAKQKKGDLQAGLEDIGYSDAIGQISSIALGLFQEDNIETLKERKIRIIKGRGGETGQFSIHWDFAEMSFAQCDPPVDVEDTSKTDELQWI
jgi:replicative DNA helicase